MFTRKREKKNVADVLTKVGMPQQVYAKLYTWLILQVNDGPMGSQIRHPMKVVGSHGYLLLSNIESVGSIPPSLSQSVDQHIASRTLMKKVHKWPEVDRIH